MKSWLVYYNLPPNPYNLKMNYSKILENLKKEYNSADIKKFEAAFEFAKTAHAGQKRKSGED